jgi:hypothetical protein
LYKIKKLKNPIETFCAINEIISYCCGKIQQNHEGGEYLVLPHK